MKKKKTSQEPRGNPPPLQTRWKPGQSGNPSGRPKSRDVREVAREILDSNDGTEGCKSKLQHLLSLLYRRGCQGNMKATELLLAYAFGRPKMGVEVTGADGVPLFNMTDEQRQARIDELLALREPVQ